MYKQNILLSVFILSWILMNTSCSKFLDKKTDQSLSIVSTVDDLHELLVYYPWMNSYSPSLGEACSDNYYLTDDDWGATSELTQNLYLWQKYDQLKGDWISPYRVINTANTVIDNADKVTLNNSGEKQRVNTLKSMAYFVRAFYHFGLSQLFMKVYNKETAKSDLGIPLKLTSDLNEKITRATAEVTYRQIISDLELSLKSLPTSLKEKYLATRQAAYGELSRVYLSMQDYQKAGKYADSCLNLYHELIDYNSVDSSSQAPFEQFNLEDIYDIQSISPNSLQQSKAKVDSTLYKSYANNDIRKYAFFQSNGDGTFHFKGNYTGKPGNHTMFTGIATDEMFLNRAECFARQGDSSAALNDLNNLLRHRYVKGTFKQYSSPVSGGLIKLILKERRKELLFRGLRWTDLRRLNKESEYADTLYRFINGKEYELLPGSDRYTIQIDRRSVELSGLIQNP